MSDKPEVKKCHHCGHEWEPRVKKPKKCPQCQNPLWKSERPKRQTQKVVEVAPMPIAVSEEAAPTLPTTDTSTPESPSDVPGADEPLQPIYSRVEVDTEQEPITKRLQREAEERLRRLADE